MRDRAMKIIYGILLSILLGVSSISMAQDGAVSSGSMGMSGPIGPLSVAEEDLSPDTYPWRLKFPNGAVVDNGDGTTSIDFIGGSLPTTYLHLAAPDQTVTQTPNFSGGATTIDPTSLLSVPTRRYSNSLFTKKEPSSLQTPYDKTILDNFDVLANWTVNYGGTSANDTTNFKTSSQSIKVTSNTSVATAMSKTVALDMSSAKVIFLRFYVDNISNLSNVGIYLANDSGYANFFQYFTGAIYLKTGWNTVAINKENFLIGDGAPSWSNNIVRIRLVTIANASGQVNVSYDELSFWTNQIERPVVVFTFDDGKSSIFSEAKTMLDAYGWSATAFVYPSGGIGEAGYMTLAQLHTLQDLGWDISNHSYDHTDLTTLTVAQIDTQMENCVDWLRSNGFTNGSRFLAYPFGGYNATTETEVSKYCDFARTIFDTIETCPIGNPNRVRSKSVINTDTLATIEGYIDDVITKNGVLIFTFHDLVDAPDEATEWATADFASLLAYIATKDIDVLSLSQFVDRHKGTFGGARINGNCIITGTLSVTGHNTLEGVTSTGATGTGKLVYDTSPTFTTGLTTPLVTAAGELTLDPAGNDVILDNSNLQLQSTYALLHTGTASHFTELLNNDTDTGWYWETGEYGGYAFKVDNVTKWKWEYMAAPYIILYTSVYPSGAGNYNLGSASNYWADISYKTLTDRGCLGSFDDGVYLQDGSKVSDIEAIKAIKTRTDGKKTV